MMLLLLAAIRAIPTPTPAPGQSPVPAEVPDIRDIAPPVDLPQPVWMTVVMIGGAVLLLTLAGLIVWLCWPRTLPQPPPSPRQLALQELEKLRAQLRTLDPHAFSFEVSAVLRRYIERQFAVRALEQTSDEFLAEASHSPRFSAMDRRLLAEFLGRADMIKFGRLGADQSASETLLESANTFVQGGRL
jgi:hypothetical protein